MITRGREAWIYAAFPGATLAAALALADVAPWIVDLTFGAALMAAGAGLRVLRTPA